MSQEQLVKCRASKPRNAGQEPVCDLENAPSYLLLHLKLPVTQVSHQVALVMSQYVQERVFDVEHVSMLRMQHPVKQNTDHIRKLKSSTGKQNYRLCFCTLSF